MVALLTYYDGITLASTARAPPPLRFHSRPTIDSGELPDMHSIMRLIPRSGNMNG
jgi:hypothetical protein